MLPIGASVKKRTVWRVLCRAHIRSSAGRRGAYVRFRDYMGKAARVCKFSAYVGEACRAGKRARASPKRPGRFTQLKR